jgi:hypothetical protein
MKTPILSLICFACVLRAGPVGMHAQTPASDSTAPSYDMKAQVLLDLQAVNKKCADLVQALPSENSPGALRPIRGRSPKSFRMLPLSAMES